MKKILKWLKENERSITWLSKQTVIERGYLSRVLNKVQKPSLAVCEELFQFAGANKIDIILKDLRPDLYKEFKTYGILKDLFAGK